MNHDGYEDLAAPNAQARLEKQREIEAKLILGSYFRSWTIAENFIAEKNVNHAPFEFGYAAGVSRPLALAARPERCNACRSGLWRNVAIYRAYRGVGARQRDYEIAQFGRTVEHLFRRGRQ